MKAELIRLIIILMEIIKSNYDLMMEDTKFQFIEKIIENMKNNEKILKINEINNLFLFLIEYKEFIYNDIATNQLIYKKVNKKQLCKIQQFTLYEQIFIYF